MAELALEVAHELACLQVYDLGADGKDLKRVAEVANFAQAAERAAGGRDIFGGRSSADRKVSTPTPQSSSDGGSYRRLAMMSGLTTSLAEELLSYWRRLLSQRQMVCSGANTQDSQHCAKCWCACGERSFDCGDGARVIIVTIFKFF